jgi:glycosyltransferase involved in cell wall biosynthesis
VIIKLGQEMAKVLIYSPNVIGKAMAGAAIRPWEFAKALSPKHQVVLISPGEPQVEAQEFEVLSSQHPACQRHFQDADILIAQRLTFPLALLAKLHKVKIIIDAYVPGPLELLEHFKNDPIQDRKAKVASEVSNLILSFKMGDGILCASEKQRELWLGFLLGKKIITPTLYDQDPSLRHFLTVIPFGLSSIPPQKKGKGLKEKFGFHANDKVVLWGGGIWNWFDPLSLIKAMKIIHHHRSDIKLVFMGVKPPDPSLPITTMSGRAIQLAKEMGVMDQCVFFNYDWVPYEERQNFLLDADIGVSTHFDHLETHFSFRTRMLDYLWAQLPIIATQGDAFAELIERHQLGIVVPYQNEQAIADGILSLMNDPNRLQQIKKNLASIREQFLWPVVTEPLDQMIEQLALLPRKRNIWADGKILLRLILTKLRERGLMACLKAVYQQYIQSKPA